MSAADLRHTSFTFRTCENCLGAVSEQQHKKVKNIQTEQHVNVVDRKLTEYLRKNQHKIRFVNTSRPACKLNERLILVLKKP